MASSNVHVGSLVSHRTGEPRVQMEFGEAKLQMSPAEARDLALNLLSSAEAASADSFLVTFAKEKIGVGEAQAAGLITEFRRWRETQEYLPPQLPTKDDNGDHDAQD